MIYSVDFECLYVITEDGPRFFGSKEEMLPVLAEEKRRITLRPHPLDRWELWEMPDSDHEKLIKLLMGRAKTVEERELVKRYIRCGQRVMDSVKSDG